MTQFIYEFLIVSWIGNFSCPNKLEEILSTFQSLEHKERCDWRQKKDLQLIYIYIYGEDLQLSKMYIKNRISLPRPHPFDIRENQHKITAYSPYYIQYPLAKASI